MRTKKYFGRYVIVEGVKTDRLSVFKRTSGIPTYIATGSKRDMMEMLRKVGMEDEVEIVE